MDTRIPKRFKLLGQTIEVNLVDHIASQNGTLGEARTTQNSILLQKSVDGFPIPESQRMHIFWHEVMHHVLQAMGQQELAGEESFVDLLAGMIHQVTTTMEYDNHKATKKVRK